LLHETCDGTFVPIAFIAWQLPKFKYGILTAHWIRRISVANILRELVYINLVHI